MEQFKKDALEVIMSDRFGRYSKYIIQERALPDVRDGLKPVQRRILYAMYKDGNTADKPYRKSAKTVGLVIGNYHPHGDSSVYDAMVRLSQTWKMKQTLVDMQGNNGSIDDDPAAAMRYTEARLDLFSQLALLNDIEEDTVNYAPNFDDTSLEPSVLPALIPQILINGSSGIAAGYATNIPPHNIQEVIAATIHRLNHPQCSLDDVLTMIKGPDFPTGGIVQGLKGIKDAYSTGKGRIVVRAKVDIQKSKSLHQLVITELPYEVIKSQLVKKIDDIRLNKNLDGLVDVRDESDRNGLRIVIDIKKEQDPELILNYLYKHTECQIYYNYNLVTIINQRPTQSSLLSILDAFIAFRKDLVLRRSKFRRQKIVQRMHILEGLVKAISVLDEVIQLIRASKDKSDAKHKLMNTFQFTDAQSEAIVNLRLYRLTNTDIVLLKEELAQLATDLAFLSGIIDNETLLKDLVIKEMQALLTKFTINRKTRIEHEVQEIVIDKLSMIPNEKTIVTLSRDGYVKRVSTRSYQSSEGITPSLKDDDHLIGVVEAETYDHLLMVFENGEYALIPVYELDEYKWKDIGEHLSHYLKLDHSIQVKAAFILKDFLSEAFVITVTRKGYIKRTLIKDFEVSRMTRCYPLMKLEPADCIVASFLMYSNEDLAIITHEGYLVRYEIEAIPTTQTRSKGVKAMNLSQGDYINDACNLKEKAACLIVTEDKLMKRIKRSELTRYNRPAKGELIAKKIKSKPNFIRYIMAVDPFDRISFTHDMNQWIDAKEIPLMDKQATFANPTEKSSAFYLVKGIEETKIILREPVSSSKKQPQVKIDKEDEPRLQMTTDFEDPDYSPGDEGIEFMHFDLDS
jgi:topoisomerase IV subunit A